MAYTLTLMVCVGLGDIRDDPRIKRLVYNETMINLNDINTIAASKFHETLIIKNGLIVTFIILILFKYYLKYGRN